MNGGVISVLVAGRCLCPTLEINGQEDTPGHFLAEAGSKRLSRYDVQKGEKGGSPGGGLP